MTSIAAVVDTNIIFSALIPASSEIRDTLFDENNSFFAPDYLITEIFSHSKKLIRASKLPEESFYTMLHNTLGCIQFVSIEIISPSARQKAYDLCKDVDIKDTPFVALAIELGIPFWTGDKKLRAGLLAKGYKQFLKIN